MDKYGKDLSFDSMRGSTAKSGSTRSVLSMDAEAIAALSAAKMRCGGCGSKARACNSSAPLHELVLIETLCQASLTLWQLNLDASAL